jgi:copper chaperone CopZ
MKKTLAIALFVLTSFVVHAQYQQIDLTVFGMDCAPCAHAIHVSMKGIQGVDTVQVDLNTGLVSVKLAPANSATMHQFNQAIEKNGFTHKDASIIVRGTLSGTPVAPSLGVTGTQDRYILAPFAGASDLSTLIGKEVVVTGLLPQAARGKIASTLRYKSVTEAK